MYLNFIFMKTTESSYSHNSMEMSESTICFEVVTGVSYKATVDRLNIYFQQWARDNTANSICKIPAYNSLTKPCLTTTR